VQASTSTAIPKGELPKDNRVAPLEHFSVGDACVGHVRVHARGAVPGGPGAGAAGDGFVVAETFRWGVFILGRGGRVSRGGGVAAEAEGEVVAVALRGGAGGEGAQDYVRDALGGEDVAAYDGSLAAGGEEGFFGDEHVDWF